LTRPTVIITDGDQRAALAVVRSIGAAYRCVVAASSTGSLAGGSRFCAKTTLVPDPLEWPNEFADAIVALAAGEKASLVLPIAEAALLAILPVRSRLLPAIVPFPDIENFNALSDKQRLLEEAARLGIAIPAQQIIPHRAALGSIDVDSISYPVVLKPARSVGIYRGGRAKVSVSYARDADELIRAVQTASPAAFPLLVQQRIVGPGTGIFLLLWDGEQRAAFAHRRLCEKPPSGGVSVYRESIPIDVDLLERSRALLDCFGWRGVAMVEYKRDATTGQPYLMEVNGRFWGSLQLAVDAGVDFPRLLAECALGAHAVPQAPYRLGVRSRWWWGQVDHLVGRIGSASRALTDLLLGPFRRADYEEILRWNDPRPFWNETVRWMGAR
jgi:predicted ATP-grasp superfamily ATP-dependent carboligase